MAERDLNLLLPVLPILERGLTHGFPAVAG
jgi:hypothetical protein